MLGLNILLFVVVLMVMVLIHEAGHMVVAKWCGMRVERFSIFFGRPLWSFRRGETEYGIGWLPLGGYVKISGMTREEEIPEGERHRAYYNAATWKRVATILAGPAVNIVAAVLVFASIAWIGQPRLEATPVVATVQEGSPAAATGLRAGDRIVAVNGVAADDFSAVRAELEANAGQPVRVRFVRDGETLVRTSPPLANVGGEGRLGFTPAVEEGPVVREGPIDGLVHGLDVTWFVIEANVEVIGNLFVSEEARDQLNSVVGVGVAFDEVADDGTRLLQLIGLLSLALGIFNLLPLLPLDGGHILFALIEKVRGKHLSAAIYSRSAIVGMAVLLLVFVVALQNDIEVISSGGFGLDEP